MPIGVAGFVVGSRVIRETRAEAAQSAAVMRAFGNSFLDGFHLALLVAGLTLLVAAFVSWRYIPSGAPAREAALVPLGVEPQAEAAAI